MHMSAYYSAKGILKGFQFRRETWSEMSGISYSFRGNRRLLLRWRDVVLYLPVIRSLVL